MTSLQDPLAKCNMMTFGSWKLKKTNPKQQLYSFRNSHTNFVPRNGHRTDVLQEPELLRENLSTLNCSTHWKFPFCAGHKEGPRKCPSCHPQRRNLEVICNTRTRKSSGGSYSSKGTLQEQDMDKKLHKDCKGPFGLSLFCSTEGNGNVSQQRLDHLG